METIDVKQLENIKDLLDEMGDEEPLFVDDGDNPAYVILREDYFETLEAYRSLLDAQKVNMDNPNVKILSNQINELSYDEYENIKNQLMEIFDKTFKPKPEKLN